MAVSRTITYLTHALYGDEGDTYSFENNYFRFLKILDHIMLFVKSHPSSNCLIINKSVVGKKVKGKIFYGQ